MKIVEHITLGDNLRKKQQRTLSTLRNEVMQAIRGVDHPRGSGELIICPRSDSKHFPNGVKPMQTLYSAMMKEHDFISEYRWPDKVKHPSALKKNPRVRDWIARHVMRGNAPGAIDHFKVIDGLRVGVEWETGYVGSTHRTVNRLLRGIIEGVIEAGILVVPDRALQMHCTDRSANFEEFEGYMAMWELILILLRHGHLEVIVVSYDRLDPSVPYLPKQAKKETVAV